MRSACAFDRDVLWHGISVIAISIAILDTNTDIDISTKVLLIRIMAQELCTSLSMS
jgi:hypothetical protein